MLSPVHVLVHQSAGPVLLRLAALFVFTACAPRSAPAQPSPVAKPAPSQITFDLQTRDPDTGNVVTTRETVDPRKVGVIAVDVWNYHWCKTATMRVDALVPRINRALQGARELGMTVMLCPSDVVDNYAGFPQREAVLALQTKPVPLVGKVDCPPVPDAGGCACGRERCAVNYGWDGMHPALEIGKVDWMPDTQAEVYAICQQRGLTHLIYVGFHTQVCLLGKPMGLRAMKEAGLRCVLARDMTDAHPGYVPEQQFTPDLNTQQVVEHFERYLSPTIDLAAELRKLQRWDDSQPLDPVRVAPWGTVDRPHLFETPITVTLSAPLQPDAEIRYTLDGSAPTPRSTLYERPFEIADSTRLRSAAFREGNAVSPESTGAFDRLLFTPPVPQVHLDELKPARSVGFGHTYAGEVRHSGDTRPPQPNASNRGGPLAIDRQIFERGIGVHAPCALTYELEPEYKRFVALAGVDEYLIGRSNGSNLAKYPSVVFKVFIDGREAAASPVMRIQSPAWRFNVAIPEGARTISLIALDAGDGHREDYADWANAGFLTSE